MSLPALVTAMLYLDRLEDHELAALNNVVQFDLDPQEVIGYDKVVELFSDNRNGHPVAPDLVKDAFAQAVLTRLA